MLMSRHLTRLSRGKLVFIMLVLAKVRLYKIPSSCHLKSSNLNNNTFIIIYLSGRSVKEFVEACKAATGVEIKVDYLSRRPGDYAEVYSDPSKINRELNWTAKYTDLQQSLSIAWRWQKSHRNGYRSS